MYICRLPLFVSRCDFILASWLFGQLLIDDVLAEILPDHYNLSSGKAIKVVFAVVLYEVVLGFILSGLSSELNQGRIDITTGKVIMIGRGNSPYKYLTKCNIQYLGPVRPKGKVSLNVPISTTDWEAQGNWCGLVIFKVDISLSSKKKGIIRNAII